MAIVDLMETTMADAHDLMTAQMVAGSGFIAALDQSGGSTPGALEAYGIAKDAWSSEDQMFALVHEMRVRIVTAPSFTGARVLAAILFEKTMDGTADDRPVPTYLWDRGIVPLLKVDKGLEDEADGVQLMKPIGGLDELLARARQLGVFGTKMRSVVKGADARGIGRIVAQQFEVGAQIAGHGLMPILEPEVSIKIPDRAAAETMLRDAILDHLAQLPDDRRVMLKLSIPAEPDLYAPLIAHPKVARVVALSGGFARAEACRLLAENHGMIASFSRALLEDLRHDMDAQEFDRALDDAIDEIWRASTLKVAA